MNRVTDGTSCVVLIICSLVIIRFFSPKRLPKLRMQKCVSNGTWSHFENQEKIARKKCVQGSTVLDFALISK